MSSLRDLPSVDLLLQKPSVQEWVMAYGRPLTLSAIREALDETREQYPQTKKIPSQEQILAKVHTKLNTWTSPSLLPVINATGVILHTNLGRSPLSQAALHAIQDVSLGYSNLEYDLSKGQRGSRLAHAEALLKRLTGTEAALVVNNNAGAVLLVLTALARRRAAVIARSQLVEIGGGFRVPDVMKQSGARLVEVGTTNRVHPSDYSQAIAEEAPALILRAHRSNFRITGFTSEPSLEEIAVIAHQAGIPLVDDLGSGSLFDTARYGLGHEPTVGESLLAGADLVCFSGDKLLGGPQAGIILGRAELIAKLKKHPLARAIRADKLCLAALSATLLHYLKDEAEREIPVWRMISASVETQQQRALGWMKTLGSGEVLSSQSTVGGGSLPEETLLTYVLALKVAQPNRFMEMLRALRPPIIARLEGNHILLDPRTVLQEQEQALLKGLQNALSNQGRKKS
jgi:L-seryl-tRNA(Ser) seleniumtransferase